MKMTTIVTSMLQRINGRSKLKRPLLIGNLKGLWNRLCREDARELLDTSSCGLSRCSSKQKHCKIKCNIPRCTNKVVWKYQWCLNYFKQYFLHRINQSQWNLVSGCISKKHKLFGWEIDVLNELFYIHLKSKTSTGEKPTAQEKSPLCYYQCKASWTQAFKQWQ